ncbi:MAG TPA: ribosome biogenesis GTPase Der [Stellaceae bacterium]|nr:ribosome biogenesis GTPase Der [Stellaceae bacterium]
MTATVAIVGRPNVGKSTLFNRLTQRRLALVDDTPGVTRDWREGEARLGDLDFRVLDTAGLEEAQQESLAARMSEQTERAIGNADVVLFLIDARAGVTPVDRHFAERLRRRGVPTLVVANKTEGRAGEAGLLDAYELGLGEPIAISAEHGEGMAELYESLRPIIEGAPAHPAESEPEASEAETPKPLQLAVVGRPNVGKSTLVNRLIGEERVLTGPEAGITRDAIAVEWRWRGKPVRLIDTAGLRRKAKVEAKLERLSVADTLRAIRFAEVVVLVIDAEQMLERQDLAIARLVEEEGRALVIAVNKWDLVTEKPKALQKLRDRLETSLPQLQGVASVTLSAKTGRSLDRLMPAVFAAHEAWNRRIATPALNRWLEAVQARHPPPLVAGRRLKIRYMTQANIRPPTFALFASKPGDLPESYRGYLVKRMREDFDLPGVPIRMMLRKGKNPYAEKR